jgi:HK97 family phage major capsid protein
MTYLERLLSQYTETRAALDALLNTAVTENRDLTADEETRSDQLTTRLGELDVKIEKLEPIEARNKRIEKLAGDIAADVDQDEQGAGTDTRQGETRGDGRPSNTTARDRDPGHYRSVKQGGRNSFFHDLVHARPEVSDDVEARQRIQEHQRALTTGVAGAGLVPPHWMTELYAPLARQERRLANVVRHIDLGDDPRPMTLPHQTTGTDNVVAEQATENTHPSETDAFATSTVTVTPKPTSGIQVVSRQMIDMTDPAVDELIYGDMLAVYDVKVEAAVAAALVAAAGVATVTFATEADFNDVTPPASLDAIITTEFAVWGARKLPPDVTAMRIGRWGKYRKLRDIDGRALIPPEMARQVMVNVEGVGTVEARGQIEDTFVIPTDGLGSTAYPENILVLRSRDTILFEGATQRFRFEEVAGPESIKLGIWAYTAVTVRYASSVERIEVTAA